MMHIWGFWMEGVGIAIESFIESLRPMQLLNAMVVMSLVVLYTFGRESKITKLLALWAVGAASIVLWVTCTVVLRRWGM
jgi:hypothetical protein